MGFNLIELRKEIHKIDEFVLFRFLERYKQGKSKCEYSTFFRAYPLYTILLGGYGLIDNLSLKSSIELDQEIISFIDYRTYFLPELIAEIKYKNSIDSILNREIEQYKLNYVNNFANKNNLEPYPLILFFKFLMRESKLVQFEYLKKKYDFNLKIS